MLSVSATIPCPANAASPCRRTGRTFECSRASPSAVCLARTIPSTTGSTNSRWLGFGASETPSFWPEGAVCVPTAPRWYFTSPDPRIESASTCPSNSAKICPAGFPTVFTRTVRRPRWDIPITASPRSDSAARSRRRSRRGIAASPPSSEKRFWPTYFVWRNFSKDSARTSASRIRRRSSRERFARLREPSIRSMSHCFCAVSWLYMNSAPIFPQYVWRRTSRISRSVAWSRPARPFVMNGRSRSHSVKPYVAGSRSGWYGTASTPSGFTSATRWPRTRYALMSCRTRACFSTASRRFVPPKKGELASFSQRIGRCGTFRSSKIRS